MNLRVNIALSLLLAGLVQGPAWAPPCRAADASAGGEVRIAAEGVYRPAGGDSDEKARELARYEARRKAVEAAAKYLSLKGLVEVNERKRDEIFRLTTREIDWTVLDEGWSTDGKGKFYFSRLAAAVGNIDFIKAEIRSLEIEKGEAGENFRDDMDQPVAEAVDPALDIAKAYRLFRKAHWRMAVIYLGHLEGKYPGWGEVPFARAIAMYVLHDPVATRLSLTRACGLDYGEACEDLKRLQFEDALDFKY